MNTNTSPPCTHLLPNSLTHAHTRAHTHFLVFLRIFLDLSFCLCLTTSLSLCFALTHESVHHTQYPRPRGRGVGLVSCELFRSRTLFISLQMHNSRTPADTHPSTNTHQHMRTHKYIHAHRDRLYARTHYDVCTFRYPHLADTHAY